MNLLQAENIVKCFSNHTALDNVSIVVPKGSIFGLLGPNGAGKTTLIRIINRITAPDSGVVYFNNQPLEQKHINQIGYLPEERGLYKKMKVGEQALYLAELRGVPHKIALERLKYWFRKFEIQTWWERKVEELSKGMQQKVQFIVTVLHEPQLLIFDEPFSGFDPINVNILKEEILRLKDEGVTIIFSTHNMNSVEELCDHIALINQSKKILDGQIDEIREKFKSNIFEVSFDSEIDEAKLNGNGYFELLETKQEKNKIKIKVRLLKQSDTNLLLTHLTTVGKIIGFTEIIPGMNEIFIKVVEEHK